MTPKEKAKELVDRCGGVLEIYEMYL